MPAAWVPSSGDPMVPVWEGEGEPTQNPAEMDSDGDGLSDWLEQYLGSSPGNPDSDYDGLSDSFELWTSNTSPINWDSDSDGYSDHDAYYGCWNVNHQTAGYGVTVYDWDGDGYYNPDDAWPFDPNNGSTPWVDSDGDGIPDHEDAWPNDYYNGYPPPTASDTDGDGIPDDQDDWPNDPYNGNPPPPPDSDGDGIPDDQDAWPNDPYNGNPPPTDPDTDGDGVPDSTDTHPENSVLWNDHDGNGINDHEEPPDPYDPWTADGDGDGRVDASDSHPGDALLWSDWDNDELNAEEEQVLGTSPYERDTDYDGLADGEEVDYQTNPLHPDTDADGLTDYEELTGTFGSSALDKFSLSRGRGWGEAYSDWQLADLQDTDGDSIPDRIEDIYAPYLNRHNATDAGWDADADGTSNLAAYQNGWAVRAYVTAYDRDGDGIDDAVEDQYPGILDKFRFADAVEDPDGDDLMNWQEIQWGSHPGNAYSGKYGANLLVIVPNDGEVYLWASLNSGNAERIAWALARLPAAHHGQVEQWQDGTFTIDEDDQPTSIAAGLEAFMNAVPPEDRGPGRVAPGDYDGDGLPDVWEWKFRAVLDPLDATDAGPDQTPEDVIQPPQEPDWSTYYNEVGSVTDVAAFTAAQEEWAATLAAHNEWRQRVDPDDDGLTNLTEYGAGTHPLIPDSDGDGYKDGLEYHQGGNPSNGTVLPPLMLAILGGDGQVVAAGETMAGPLILRATRAGLSAAGVAVSAAASGGALSSSFNGPWASSKVVSTNVNGEAAFLWQPPAASGTWTVQVVAAGAGGKTFHLTTTMPALVMTATGGQGQAAEVGTVAAQPLAVQIGRGSLSMAGLPVTFTASGGQGEVAASVAGPWQSSVTVPANAQGHAAVYWKAPATAGGYGVQASVTSGTGADAATVEQGFALQAFVPGGGTGGTGGTGGNGNTGGPVPGKLEMKIWERSMLVVKELTETMGDKIDGVWQIPDWLQGLQMEEAYQFEEDTGRIHWTNPVSFYEVRAGGPPVKIAGSAELASSADYAAKLVEAEGFYSSAASTAAIFGYPNSSQSPLIQYHDVPSTNRSAQERRIKYVVNDGELQTEQSVAYLVRYRSESYAAGSGPPIEKWFTVTFTAPEGANPGAAANVSIKGLLLEATACGITSSGNELHLNPPPIQNGKSELHLLPVDLKLTGIASHDELSDKNVIIINADNDNGSAWQNDSNNTIPQTRDYLHPGNVSAEDDLQEVTLTVPHNIQGITLEVKVSKQGHVKAWMNANKTQEIIIGDDGKLTFPGNYPSSFFLEGIKVNDARGEMSISLAVIQGATRTEVKEIKFSVGPVFYNMSVENKTADNFTILVDGGTLHYLLTPPGTAIKAHVYAGNNHSRIRFLQNLNFSQPLAVYTRLQKEGPARAYQWNPDQGLTFPLLDTQPPANTANNIFFETEYGVNASKDEFWVKDAPSHSIPLLILNGEYKFDAAFFANSFSSQVVYAFTDGTILPLGQTEWVIVAAVSTTFQDANGNNQEDPGERTATISSESSVSWSGSSTKTSSPLPRLIPPVANEAMKYHLLTP